MEHVRVHLQYTLQKCRCCYLKYLEPEVAEVVRNILDGRRF